MNFWNLSKDEITPPRCEYYIAAGAICSVATNSEAIQAAARQSFAQAGEPLDPPDVSMYFWVDSSAQSCPPWPQAYFRGLNHLVFAGFDSENAFLVDLQTQRILGRLSPSMAADRIYWKRVIFPALFGIVCQTIGITPIHCACVARDGDGALLAGDSGAGKSTLSLALAQIGLTFLSDDWTYLSRRDGRLLAWGLNTPLKLLAGAAQHFPELAVITPDVSFNGELAYEVEPDRMFGIRRSACAEPRWLIFLERQEASGVSLAEMPSAEAAARFEENLEGLPSAVSGARDFLVETIRILVQRPCWLLRFGGKPHAVARALYDFLEDHAGAHPSRRD